jgi:hypothetical protein
MGWSARREPPGSTSTWSSGFPSFFTLIFFALLGMQAVTDHMHFDLDAGQHLERPEGPTVARCASLVAANFGVVYPNFHRFVVNRRFGATGLSPNQPAFDRRMSHRPGETDAEVFGQATHRRYRLGDGLWSIEAGAACRTVHAPKSGRRVQRSESGDFRSRSRSVDRDLKLARRASANGVRDPNARQCE